MKKTKQFIEKPFLLSDEEMESRLNQSILDYEKLKLDTKAKKIKGYRLVVQMPDIAKQLGFNVEEMSVYHKIQGNNKKAILISRNGNKVDLSGFTIDDPAFKEIPQNDVKKRHMGRIKARLSLDLPDKNILEAYFKALKELNSNI
jgi:hypothetical protein